MSSNEDEYNDESPLAKKRRVQRACDMCRRKKVRCDGAQLPSNKCSNCIVYTFECTYIESSKKRGPSKGYVQSLENRLQKLESILSKIRPDEKALKELDVDCWPINATTTPGFQHSTASRIATTIIRGVNATALGETNYNDISQATGDDDDADALADRISRLAVSTDSRFLGSASSAGLVSKAFEVKDAYTGMESGSRPLPRRSEFWDIRPWEAAARKVEKARYTFPPPDLLASLVDRYFTNVNTLLPLLHRPTFERSLATELYNTDDDFAATVLLVCAVGSRYSDDERVKLDSVDNWHSSGWKWYNQVQAHRRPYGEQPTVYDLQFYCLAVEFLQGVSAPHFSWTMIGIGIRLAQDVGAHRRKKDMHKSMTAEEEMSKRAFWVLVCLDLMVSTGLGRPCAIQDEDFDTDFPVECDDEYWFNSNQAVATFEPSSTPAEKQQVFFEQPPDKPSLITAFVLFLKLNKVLTMLFRTIYSLNKNKVLLGFVGPEWEQHIVSELDSALNQWVDSIPEHLRWDPNRENPQFFDQSAYLYVSYYHVQILIHRPFIPSPNKPSLTPFPSLAICTNAARSCCHIVEAQRKRGLRILPHLQLHTFTAAIVLLLNVWGGKRLGATSDPSKEMADVRRCLDALKACESRWHSAGRLRDIVCELAFAGDLPLPASPPMSNKRDRDADSPGSQHSSSPYGSLDPFNPAGGWVSSPDAHVEGQVAGDGVPRTMAGSRRAYRHHNHQHQPRQEVAPQLPVYSTDLGTFPWTPSFASMASTDTGGNTFEREKTYGGDLGINGVSPAGSSPSPYPEVPGGTVPHQMATGMEGYGSLFTSAPGPVVDAGNPRVYSRLESHPDRFSLPSSGGPEAFNSPWFGGAGDIPGDAYASSMTRSNAGLGMDGETQGFVTYDMWSNAPSGIEFDEWDRYLTNVSAMTQSFGIGT